MQENKTIIYIDNNEDHRELLKFLFEDAGFKILTCSMLKEGFDRLSENEISAVVMDYWIDGIEAAEAGKKIKELYPVVPFFFLPETRRQKVVKKH